MADSSSKLHEHAHRDARGLARRIVLGVLSQFTTLGSLIVRNILVVPFFLTAHGVDGYADWVKLMALASFGMFVTLGQHIHYGYEIRTSRAARELDRMNGALADANGFYLRLYLVVALLLALLFAVVDLAAVLNLSVLTADEAALVFALLLASLTGQAYRDTLRGVYIAHGELSRSEFIQTGANLLLAALVIAALLLGASLPMVAAVYLLVVPILVCGAALFDFHRRYPEVAFRINWAWPRLGRERLRNIVAHTLPDVAEKVVTSGPTVLLGVFGVAADVVVQFNLARTATTVLRARPIAMVFATEMVRQRVQEDWAGFHRLHLRGALAIGVYGGGLFGGLMGSWDLFLPLWTNGTVHADMLLFAFLVAETAVITFGEHSSSLLRFGGRMAQVAWSQTLTALAFLLLAVPALAFGGLYPMLATMLLGSCLFLYVLPAAMAQQRMQGPLAVGLALPLLTGLVTAAAAYATLLALRELFGL